MGGFFPVDPSMVSGGGGENFLNNLFKNKMFLQMLSAGGQDLTSGRPGHLNAAVQQNISSQNYMKVLQKMLGGEVPEDGSMTVKADGITFKVPRQTGGQPGVGIDTALDSQGGVSAPTSGGGSVDLNKMAAGLSNPFTGSQQIGAGLSASDLAGVPPELISQALGLKQTQQELNQRRVRDVMDALYRGSQLELQERGLANEERQTEGMLGIRTASEETDRIRAYNEWLKIATADQRTAFQKDYEYAVANGFKGSPADWKVISDDPETIKLYKAALADGSFKGGLWDFIKQRAKAGASSVNIGLEGKLRERAAFSELQGRDYFNSPGWTKDVDSIDAGSDEVFTESQRLISSGLPYAEATSKAVLSARLNTVAQKIKAGKGEIIGREKEGNTYVWIVKWPDIVDADGKVLMKGKEERIRYASK